MENTIIMENVLNPNKALEEYKSYLLTMYVKDYGEKYYKPDAEILERLLDMLKDISQSKDGVEGLSYRDLIKTLDKVVNRCYGKI